MELAKSVHHSLLTASNDIVSHQTSTFNKLWKQHVTPGKNNRKIKYLRR